ncbi:dihydrodipicolinate synthase family protein [Pseudonocardia acaciae]|uniref:dihydrodipicolinate synthase family protein n=1 Tax=Pseudonocardia acaciae TaxID=551276 RepID=UPI000491E2FC|nr:dihydrodipicolinate synthase family protein [Pseudonocardia acaciae]
MGLFGSAGRFVGYFGTPLTPYDDDLEIDAETFVKHVRFMVDSGVSALCWPMHLAESLNLTVEERTELARLTVAAVAGDVPVTIHTSCPGTDQVIELSRHAQRVGAAGVVVATPYHWRPVPAALEAHFAAVGQAIDIDLLTYSYPDAMQVTVDAGLAARLIERLPNYLGVKDAGYDMQDFTELCRVTSGLRPDFSVFTGIEYLLPNMAVGGAGSFSACGMVAPRLLRSLYQAVSKGDYAAALPLQHRISRLWFLLRPGYPATIKAAMEIMGRPVGGARLPILALEPAAKEALRARLAECGVLDEEPYGWDATGTPDPERAGAARA